MLIVVLLLRRIEVLRQAQDKVVGICAAAIGQDARKQDNKERILALLNPLSPLAPATPSVRTDTPPLAGGDGERQEGMRGLANADIREALQISERSVVRYMDELEKEGRVEQVGNTGRGVIYRLK